MSSSRWIREHRSAVLLAVLVVLSILSLASGMETTFIQRGIRTLVTFVTKPCLDVLDASKGGVEYVTGLVVAYDATVEELTTMRRQFVRQMQLVSDRRELMAENRRLRKLLDFERGQPRLTLEAVEVIENFKGMLKIDRGAWDGIEPSMGVLTEAGVVGFVTEVDWTTATVVTLHSVDCKVGAMIRRNRVRGIVHGSGSDLSRLCTLEYIDMNDDVQEQDEVVTSPESMFPAGYPIGRVASVHDTDSLWKYAYVEPAVDPYRLDEVFVVRRAVPGPEELTGPSNGPRRPPEGLAPPPETDPVEKPSLQERYAP